MGRKREEEEEGKKGKGDQMMYEEGEKWQRTGGHEGGSVDGGLRGGGGRDRGEWGIQSCEGKQGGRGKRGKGSR